MRKIKDAKDLSTNELIYFKGHAKATYMSDGRNVEEAIHQIGTGGGGGASVYTWEWDGNEQGSVTNEVFTSIYDSDVLYLRYAGMDIPATIARADLTLIIVASILSGDSLWTIAVTFTGFNYTAEMTNQEIGGSYDDTAIRNELSKKLESEVVGTTEPTDDFEVNAEIKAQLAELSGRIEVQFVNENKGITGAGTIVNSTGEKCTNIVAIKGAKSVKITSLYPGANTFFYDQAKTLISSSSGAKTNAQVEVPEEAYYVAVTDLMSNASSLLAYNLTEVQVWLNDKINKVNLPLIGKVLSVNGDSICQGKGYRGGYAKIIGERNAMVVENLGDGGAVITFGKTFSDGTARHCIANTITSMREDADYILIEGGANDAGLSVPVGKISDGYNATLDTSTYCGAFEYMLKMLVSRFAGKKYGYIAVHQCVSKYRVTDTDKSTSYYWLAKSMCEKWGVPFCDLNSTVPPFNYLSNSSISEVNATYTDNGDGWHPNEEGYKKYYCDKIEAFMLSL